MNQGRRIILNIVATYGRTLVGLFVGLFCGRWTLMSLGETDFGLYGLIGGLILIFSVLNPVFAAANARFFAVALGEASQASGDPSRALEECRKWFNSAVQIHTVAPTILLLVGYPFCVWLVRNVLAVPPDRLESCLWVLRFACVTGYASMVSVPFLAMYVAKQCIAELTIYGFAQSILHFCFVWYMVSHDGDWLTRYALWMCLLEVVPYVLYCSRACRLYRECRFDRTYWGDWRRLRQIGKYVFWQAFASLSQMLGMQGLQVLANRCFGAAVNASISVSNKVLTHATSLTSATGTAFQPVIASAYGEGDLDRVRVLAARTTKLALVFGMVFVMPLCLEMDSVLALWLKTPPPHATYLCTCVLLAYLADKIGYGEALAIEAAGRVAACQFVYGGCQVLVLVVAWVLSAQGWGIEAIGIGLLVGMSLGGSVRVLFAARLVGMSIVRWALRLALPLSAAGALALVAGMLARSSFAPCVARIPVTALAFEAAFVPMVWFFLLDDDERNYLRQKLLGAVCVLTGFGGLGRRNSARGRI